MKQYTNEHDQRTYDEILNKFHKGSDKTVNSIIDKIASQATEAYLGVAGRMMGVLELCKNSLKPSLMVLIMNLLVEHKYMLVP